MRRGWIVVLLALSGCATTAHAPAVDAWLLKPEWTSATAYSSTTLTGKSGKVYQLQAANLDNLKAVLLAMNRQSGMDPNVALVASTAPNAFATVRDGKQVIGLTLSMLDGIGPDKDALATTVGHELAHLKLAHGDIRRQRAESATGISQVLGVVLGAAGVPLSGSIANFGVGLVTTAYSRDEERDADVLGLQWAMAAGYSACGSARTMRMLKAQSSATPLPFLASHPGSDERIERANQTAIGATGKGC